jgi:hypothetical protein
MKKITKYLPAALLFVGIPLLAIFWDDIFERELSTIPEAWHGRYTLDPGDEHLDSEIYDLEYIADFKKGIKVSETEIKLFGKKLTAKKITVSRFRGEGTMLNFYYSSYEKLELQRKPNGDFFVSEYQERPTSPDSDAWIYLDHYKIREQR